jgi:hypothetical protein
MCNRSTALLCFASIAVLATSIPAQAFPDLMYYRFDEGTGVGGTTHNDAFGSVAPANATVVGHSLLPGAGQFGSGALVGASPVASNLYVNTGWPLSFGVGDWTISFYFDLSAVSPVPIPPATNPPLYYFFGAAGVSPNNIAFRSFVGGVAGQGITFRCNGQTNVNVANVWTTGPHVVTFVRNATPPNNYVRAFLDGALAVNVNQTTLLSMTNTDQLAIGGYPFACPTCTFAPGGILDEFRVYLRALSDAEVAASAYAQLFQTPQVIPVGAGCQSAGGFTPVLSSAFLPTLGNAAFAFDISQVYPGLSTYAYLSAGIAAPPFPVVGACPIYLEWTSAIAFLSAGFYLGPATADASGVTTFPVPIPPNPAFAGLQAGLQGAVIDPFSPTGLTLTNALALILN